MKKLLIACALLTGCSYANLDDVKAHAPAVWKQAGFTIIGYEGFQWGWLGVGPYGGANVWYTLKREEAPGVIYGGYLYRWGDEYHIYAVRAYDAIKP